MLVQAGSKSMDQIILSSTDTSGSSLCPWKPCLASPSSSDEQKLSRCLQSKLLVCMAHVYNTTIIIHQHLLALAQARASNPSSCSSLLQDQILVLPSCFTVILRLRLHDFSLATFSSHLQLQSLSTPHLIPHTPSPHPAPSRAHFSSFRKVLHTLRPGPSSSTPLVDLAFILSKPAWNKVSETRPPPFSIIRQYIPSEFL